MSALRRAVDRARLWLGGAIVVVLFRSLARDQRAARGER